METLFHELSHSLGPGTITVGGRQTTVDKELKDIAGGFEEAKADVMGAYNIMLHDGQGRASRPPSGRRSAPPMSPACSGRCASAPTRRTAAARRCSTAICATRARSSGTRGAKRFRIDEAKIDGAIRDLVGEIVRLQGNGDYAGTKAFLDKCGVLDAEASR